jgi:CRISPR-associated endonuclease Cas1
MQQPNALWLERITTYKCSPLALGSARVIIDSKINRQNALLKKYKRPPFVGSNKTSDPNSLLLLEARAAKHFWTEFRYLMPPWTNFSGRKARHKDVVNTLLDIGYHHLSTQVKKILEAHTVTFAPALLHVAHREKSAPLVYDLMEMFRSDVVDSEVLKFVRLKRKPILRIEQADIAQFVYRINQRLEKKRYLRDFGQCHSYRYYLELQVIKFIKAVNHQEVFAPMQLPARHDTRCTCVK